MENNTPINYTNKTAYNILTTDTLQKTTSKCPFCDNSLYVDTSMIYTSHPAKYKLSCSHCVFTTYINCTDVKLESDIDKSDFISKLNNIENLLNDICSTLEKIEKTINNINDAGGNND